MLKRAASSLAAWFRRTESLGAYGERLAARHLKRQGFRIIERNVHVHADEVDLIAIDPDGHTVVIVEVKTRRDDGIPPESAIHRDKQRFMARVAAKLHKTARFQNSPFRFDAVAVIVPEDGKPIIRHIPGAFQAR